MRVLITGSSGFIGSRIVDRLAGDPSWQIVAATRGRVGMNRANIRHFTHGELSAHTDWQDGLAGVNAVIHLAARVHVMQDTASDPLAEFRRVNVEASLRLARQAAQAGVRRFVYLSSIKVNGESTSEGHPFTADAPPDPKDAYGVSKLEAERALRELAATSGMEVVVIRPPLVYGPGVKANFRSMMKWLDRGVPLPLGAIHNRRSLVALDNLVDLLATCVDHPAAANQTFVVSDGNDLSTTELLRKLGSALGKPTRLLPVPAHLLEVVGALVGKRSVVQRVCGSLQVDVSKTRNLLGWTPPISVEEGLRRVATAFLNTSLPAVR